MWDQDSDYKNSVTSTALNGSQFIKKKMVAPQQQWTSSSMQLSKPPRVEGTYYNTGEWERHSVKWLSHIHRSAVLKGTEPKLAPVFLLLDKRGNKCLGVLAGEATTHDLHYQKPPSFVQFCAGARNAAWLTVIGGTVRLKEVSSINVSSRPYSAVCTDIFHNPPKSCHCECPLNESLSIPRLARVRCDEKT